MIPCCIHRTRTLSFKIKPIDNALVILKRFWLKLLIYFYYYFFFSFRRFYSRKSFFLSILDLVCKYICTLTFNIIKNYLENIKMSEIMEKGSLRTQKRLILCCTPQVTVYGNLNTGLCLRVRRCKCLLWTFLILVEQSSQSINGPSCSRVRMVPHIFFETTQLYDCNDNYMFSLVLDGE